MRKVATLITLVTAVEGAVYTMTSSQTTIMSNDGEGTRVGSVQESSSEFKNGDKVHRESAAGALKGVVNKDGVFQGSMEDAHDREGKFSMNHKGHYIYEDDLKDFEGLTFPKLIKEHIPPKPKEGSSETEEEFQEKFEDTMKEYDKVASVTGFEEQLKALKP